MARMHLLMNAVMEGDDEPITETAVFEGAEEFVMSSLADWLEEQARGIRADMAEEASNGAE